MNSLERIQHTLRFEPCDRPPVIAQVFGHAAVRAGVDLRTYLTNGTCLADCQLKALEHYQYDAVFALMDVGVEVEALGASLEYRKDAYPFVAQRVAIQWDQAGVPLPDPDVSGRMPELLKAARKLRAAVCDEVLVVGCVMGPMTLTSQILGAEDILYLAIDHPERFARMLDFATDVVIRFGLAQLDAGVHLPVVFDPFSSGDVVPASFYREFIVPRLTRVFTAFKQSGAAANWLHTAGPITSILPYYERMGVDLANIDYGVSLADACAIQPRLCFNGNIRSLAFIENSPSVVADAARECLQTMEDRGGFILSSGCEIPPESDPATISAMIMTTREG